MDSPTMVARTSRRLQRYDNQYRLVAGCIPYKLTEESDSSAGTVKSLQVLMISNPNRDGLIFPKGGWDSDETEEEAACREALEEAGVQGIIRGAIGQWVFKSKSTQESDSPGGLCRGTVFALEVTDQFQSWPQQACYQRKWMNVEEALEQCRYKWMEDALRRFHQFQSEETGLLVLPGPAAKKSEGSASCYAMSSPDHERLEKPTFVLC